MREEREDLHGRRLIVVERKVREGDRIPHGINTVRHSSSVVF